MSKQNRSYFSISRFYFEIIRVFFWFDAVRRGFSVSRTYLPLSPFFIITPGTAFLDDLRRIELLGNVPEELLIRVSTG